MLTNMASENDNTEQRTSSSDSATPFSSCRRKKNFGSGSFVSDLRDHVHEFLHASADEHRTCLKDTIQKVGPSDFFFPSSLYIDWSD